jgi:hypothetical protein
MRQTGWRRRPVDSDRRDGAGSRRVGCVLARPRGGRKVWRQQRTQWQGGDAKRVTARRSADSQLSMRDSRLYL